MNVKKTKPQDAKKNITSESVSVGQKGSKTNSKISDKMKPTKSSMNLRKRVKSKAQKDFIIESMTSVIEVKKKHPKKWRKDHINNSIIDFIASEDSRSSNSEPEISNEILSHIKKIVDKSRGVIGFEGYNMGNRVNDAYNEESDGNIRLCVIANSVTEPLSDEMLKWLIGLRNVISFELPHMNRSLITRFVFDLKHKNLVIVKKDEVIGGICFRMFRKQNFSEIVFVAIHASEHGNGYGTHMMNHLKDYHVKHNVYYLLTFAAMESCGFFQRQAFSCDITLESSVYDGYINSYEGATLMECQLDQKVVYTEFNEILNRQLQILKQLVLESGISNFPLEAQQDS